MGEAKRRGSKEERIKQGILKKEELKRNEALEDLRIKDEAAKKQEARRIENNKKIPDKEVYVPRSSNHGLGRAALLTSIYAAAVVCNKDNDSKES
jgi:hypothetical protein